MPFDPLNFSAFLASDSATLWFYETGDNRASVLSPDYFTPAPQLLRDGDVIICHASDALMFLPALDDTHVGSGLVLDVFLQPLRLTTSADQRIVAAQSITPVLRALVFDALPSSLLLGRSITARVQVTGPISIVTFRLLNAASAVLETIGATVSAGSATAVFTPLAPGSYRIRASTPEDSGIGIRSGLIVVTEAYSLLRESDGGSLLTEGGDELLI